MAIHLLLLFFHLREVCLHFQIQIADGIEEGLYPLHQQIRIVHRTVALLNDRDDETGLRLTVVVVERCTLLFVEGQEIADVLFVGESRH